MDEAGSGSVGPGSTTASSLSNAITFLFVPVAFDVRVEEESFSNPRAKMNRIFLKHSKNRSFFFIPFVSDQIGQQ